MLKKQIASMPSAVAVAFAVILTSRAMAGGGPCHPDWDNTIGQPGMNDFVRALTVFDDGSGGGPAPYAGGIFTTAGGVTVNRIAKWDGRTWSALGSGMSSAVDALTVFDDSLGGGPALYAGGFFFSTAGGAPASRIAKWDGTAWSPLGSGMSGGAIVTIVEALTVFDDGSGGGPALYAGGIFTTAGGVSASNIAKWDGTAWSALGEGVSGGSGAGPEVWDLTVFDDGSGGGPALYAGGVFTTAGGVTVNRIAKWDGTAWSPLGSGMNASVRALTVFDDGSGGGPALYAGGVFTTAGGATVNRIAKWDGTAWSALGSGMNDSVDAMTVFDDGSGGGPALYAGGFFSTAGGAPASRIAKWDGTAWSALGGGMSGLALLALTVFDDGSGGGPALYAGGGFGTAGGPSANHIAKWQGCPTEPECDLADLNCDGATNVDDLLQLLAAWGDCNKGEACAADIAPPGVGGGPAGDGVVNVDDLLLLLANWG